MQGMAHRVGPWLVLLLCVLLAACSRVEFFYDRADWFGARWAANYLDLDGEQRGRVREEIIAYREFHRQVRVPQAQEKLDALIRDLEDRRFQRAVLLEHIEGIRTLYRDMSEDILPVVADVLANLDASQQATLAERFRERREEMREARRAEVGDGGHLAARQERFREQAESLVGRLSRPQIRILNDCAEQFPDSFEARLDWQQERQEGLLALLADDRDPERVAGYLRAWWLESEGQPEALVSAGETRRAVSVECLLRFLPTLEDEQIRRLARRLEGYAENLQSLTDSD